MSFQKFSLLFGFLFFLMGCSKPSDQMIGKWQTDYLKIDFVSFQNSDSIFVMEDQFDNNPERVAQSEYFKDGTFKAWFLDREGKQQGMTHGTWNLKQDSLYTRYRYLGKEIQPTYQLKFGKTGFEARSLFDWDNDGQKDDHLVMRTKSVRK